jgi:hypothetical protein
MPQILRGVEPRNSTHGILADSAPLPRPTQECADRRSEVIAGLKRHPAVPEGCQAGLNPFGFDVRQNRATQYTGQPFCCLLKSLGLSARLELTELHALHDRDQLAGPLVVLGRVLSCLTLRQNVVAPCREVIG